MTSVEENLPLLRAAFSATALASVATWPATARVWVGSAYLLVGYNMLTLNPCQLGSPVWPYPALAGYPKTLHLNDV